MQHRRALQLGPLQRPKKGCDPEESQRTLSPVLGRALLGIRVDLKELSLLPSFLDHTLYIPRVEYFRFPWSMLYISFAVDCAPIHSAADVP